jgi:hypothetical protein
MTDDLATIEGRHRKHGDMCDYCGTEDPWPCDARRLLDEVDAYRAGTTQAIIEMALTRSGERARIWEAIDAEDTIDGRIHRDRLFAIVFMGQEASQ